MANLTGPQPDIKFCPVCGGKVKNVPRSQMVSSGHKRKDGSVSPHTHTYQCADCGKRFEINQAR